MNLWSSGECSSQKSFSKGKGSQGLCLSRPAAGPPERKAGAWGNLAEAGRANCPLPLPLVSIVFLQPQTSQPTPLWLYSLSFSGKVISKSILAFRWNCRNNSLTHRTERDDLIAFIFKMVKMWLGGVCWTAQAHTALETQAELEPTSPSCYAFAFYLWACKHEPTVEDTFSPQSSHCFPQCSFPLCDV